MRAKPADPERSRIGDLGGEPAQRIRPDSAVPQPHRPQPESHAETRRTRRNPGFLRTRVSAIGVFLRDLRGSA